MAQTQPNKSSSQKPSKSQDTLNNSDDIAAVSSFIERASYTDDSLTIYFKSGHTLSYHGVDSSTWEQFKLSSSKGSFYATKIKGQFDAGNIKKVPLSTDFTKPRENKWAKILSKKSV